MRFNWFRRRKKLSASTQYDTRYTLEVLNFVPKDMGFSRKFYEDSIDCEGKEYRKIKDLNVDDKNIDISTGSHKADTAREIAYLNSNLVDSLLTTTNLLSKTVGDIVLLNQKITQAEAFAQKVEQQLKEEESELKAWRGR